MRPVSDPAELAEIFERDRDLHLYGLGDLAEPFWSRSAWFRAGEAVAGIVGIPDGPPVGYAMATDGADAVLTLFASIQGQVADGVLVVGATGLAAVLSAVRPTTPLGRHLRMIRTTDAPVDAGPAIRLGVDDLPAIQALRDKQPGEAFFLHHMLEHGVFYGIYEAGMLIALAGTHVVDDDHGVAAIGSVVTRTDRRGRGLSTQVTAAVVAELTDRVRTIGLNVKADNAAAQAVYRKLGFDVYCEYEEVILGAT